jgi:hypothetical protein
MEPGPRLGKGANDVGLGSVLVGRDTHPLRDSLTPGLDAAQPEESVMKTSLDDRRAVVAVEGDPGVRPTRPNLVA